MRWATCWQRRQRRAEAQQSYFTAASGDAEQPDYAYNLAVSLERLKQPRAAAAHYRRALELAASRPARFPIERARTRLAALDGAARQGDYVSTPPATGTQRRPLGQTLIERGVLTEDQLRIALLEQKSRGIPLGKVLVALGFLTEATLREVLAENLGHREIDLSRVVPNPAALALVPGEFAQRHRVFPVSVDDEARQLTLALANPNDVMLIDQLTAMLGGSYKLQLCLAAEGDVANAITLHYGQELSIDGILNEIETGEI